MITVYYSRVSPFLEEDAFLNIRMDCGACCPLLQLQKVSSDRREKILRMRNEAAKLRSLAAGNLLHYALCEKLGLSFEHTKPFSIGYGEKGKPYLTEYPGIHFNLSHSGDYVCCAVGDMPVGVDIQEKVKVHEKLAERFFTPADQRMLSECGEEERQALFFRMWSIKESYLKLTGEGLSGGLAEFEILWEEKKIVQRPVRQNGKSGNGMKTADAYFEEFFQLKEYSFCVCTGYPMGQVSWKACFIM